jgi:hypothetical protein
MSSKAMAAPREGTLWIRDKRFDLLFLTLSGVLVFLPYLSYGFLKKVGISEGTSSLIVGLSVTILVGGPHMYSTYLRTAFEPVFASAGEPGLPAARLIPPRHHRLGPSSSSSRGFPLGLSTYAPGAVHLETY